MKYCYTGKKDIRPMKGRQTERGPSEPEKCSTGITSASPNACKWSSAMKEEEDKDGQKAITSLLPLWTDTGPGRAALIGTGSWWTNEELPKTQASYCKPISLF